MKRQEIYVKYIKRGIDLLCAGSAVICFWWLYLIIAFMVKVNLGSPVLYSQDRPGKGERIFKLYKFRSMTDKRDEDGHLLPDDQRLTKFGRILRSTSMDELPETFNILKGDMSIVGPRPLLVEYLPYYREEEHHRHDVRPGLTGWAQVNGRNTTGWNDRLKQDVDYVRTCNFLLDIKIVKMTVVKVVKRSDVLVGKQIPAGRLDYARKEMIQKEQVLQ